MRRFSVRKPDRGELPEYVLGLDLGGSTWKANLLRNGKRILFSKLREWSSLIDRGPEASLQAMRQGVIALLGSVDLTLDDIRLVGMDSPGPASEDGVLYASPNLGRSWINYPIRRWVERVLGIKTFYTNDVNAAARGEFTTLRGMDGSLVLVAPGTGLGGGAVVNGRVVNGTSGASLEVGHLQMPVGTLARAGISTIPRCGCKRRNCFETVVSLVGLSHQLEHALTEIRGAKGSGNPWWQYRNHQLLGNPGTSLDRARRLLPLAGEGDKLSLHLFRQQARVVGTLLSQLMITFDQRITRIGGGLANGSEGFRSMYRRHVLETMLEGVWPHQRKLIRSGEMEVGWAHFGARAGAIGAAHFALDCWRAAA